MHNLSLNFRFQLYNQSPHKLLFSQLHFATSFKDPAAQSTFLTGTEVIEYLYTGIKVIEYIYPGIEVIEYIFLRYIGMFVID